MTVPNYEVGRLAALTVRLVLDSGLSRADARAALGLACAMMDDEPDRRDDRDTAARIPMRPSDQPRRPAARP